MKFRAIPAVLLGCSGYAVAQTPIVTYGTPRRITTEVEFHNREYESTIAANTLDRLITLVISQTPSTEPLKSTVRGGLFRLSGAERLQDLNLRASAPQFTQPQAFPEAVFDPVSCVDATGGLWIATGAWRYNSRSHPNNYAGVLIAHAPANGLLGSLGWVVEQPAFASQEDPWWLIDKPGIGTGPLPAGSADLAVYVAWTNAKFIFFQQQISDRRVVDARIEFQRRVVGGAASGVLPTNAVFINRNNLDKDYVPWGAAPIVEPRTGKVVIVYTNSNTVCEVRSIASDDAGITWKTPVLVETDPSSEPVGGPIIAGIRSQKHAPAVAFDPRTRAGGLPNYVYTAYAVPVGSAGDNQFVMAVRVRRSSDGGETWPHKVDVPVPSSQGGVAGDQFMPGLAVDSFGGVHVTYLSTAAIDGTPPSQAAFKWYHTRITWPDGNGSPAATTPVQISTTTTYGSDLVAGTGESIDHWTEYHSMGQTGQHVYASWTQVDPNVPTTNKLRGYFMKITTVIPEVGGGPD